MIWQLVKRDPAWRNAQICMVAGAAICLAPPREVIVIFGFALCMICMRSQPQQRATLFQAALPIRARDLWLARLISFLVLAWLPVAAGVAMLLLAGKPPEDVGILVEIGAGLSVLVLTLQSGRVRELQAPAWTRIVAAAVLCLFIIPIAKFVPPAEVLMLCGATGTVLFWNIWRQLPPAFDVLPEQVTTEVSSQGTSAAPSVLWSPILRSLFPPRTWLFLLIILSQVGASQWLLAAFFCLSPIQIALGQMSWPGSLPVRRSALLAAIVLPWISSLLLAFLLNSVFLANNTPVQFDWHNGNASAVRPPMEFWRVAPEGKAPLIQSPWHESWQPQIVRLGGLAVYNPYGMGADNSRRFFEWQYQRATLAVYGQQVAFRDYKRLASLRPLSRQSRFVLLNLAALVCWVTLLLHVMLIPMHWRIRRIDRGRGLIGWLIWVPIVCPILFDVLTTRQPSGSITVTLLNALLLRVSAALPDSLPAVALAAVLPVALLFWTATRLFRGVEIQLPAVVRW